LDNYNRSMGEIILKNKSRIKLFSGEEPDRLRGPQFHGGWFDELASFKSADSFDQYRFALRLGDHPQTIITTTPRPTKQIKDLALRPDVRVIRGSTFDNAANLSESALAEMRSRYEGTRLGRQELYGEIIDDVEGALWTRDSIEASRVNETPVMVRIVVGVDPAVTSGESSDMTGIVVAGITPDGHYYILEDASMKGTPDAWARKVVDCYHRWQADRVIGETNNGGDMIELLLRQVDPSISYRKVTATRGKLLRAEPVAALYEQQRVHHAGTFPEMEDQMCNWTPDSNESPDRMDAMVWAMAELMGSQTALMGLAALAKFCSSCRMPNSKTATICSSCHQPL
jgi:predicted phage terminase large subunit-like protein